MEREFSRQIFEKHSYIKHHEVGAEVFHADGQTEMTKLIVTFSNFANAPKNCLCWRQKVYFELNEEMELKVWEWFKN